MVIYSKVYGLHKWDLIGESNKQLSINIEKNTNQGIFQSASQGIFKILNIEHCPTQDTAKSHGFQVLGNSIGKIVTVVDCSMFLPNSGRLVVTLTVSLYCVLYSLSPLEPLIMECALLSRSTETIFATQSRITCRYCNKENTVNSKSN